MERDRELTPPARLFCGVPWPHLASGERELPVPHFALNAEMPGGDDPS